MVAATIIRDGTNTPRTITAIQVRDGTNTPRTITEIRVRDSNNVSRIVYSTAPPFSASASPGTVSGIGATSTLTTDASTIIPVGGTAPYTYQWTLNTYDAPIAPTANSPTSATSTFTQTGITFGESYSAEWGWLVTDSSVPPLSANGTISSFWIRS